MGDCLSDSEFERYLSGELNDRDRARVQQHLDACTSCRQRFDEYQKLSILTEEWRALLHETQTSVPSDRTVPRILQPGDWVGPCVIIERIGQGAFGEVYHAERRRPFKQNVALKVIRADVDARRVMARFELERQMLALMDHPHIARIYDAGTSFDRRPYFIMQYVPGEPITAHCDRNRLSVRRRLGLFAQVCRAVHHAHQRTVIHRDLKPSNILVRYDDEGEVPVVIDFGVAKALNQEVLQQSVLPEAGVAVGTLEYMAPEQAGMDAQGIDTRADVYSLGVLLYELLTGTLPFESETLRSATFEEQMRIIREVPRPRPSSKLSIRTESGTAAEVAAVTRQIDARRLTRMVRREFDWIIMKCLEKDRTLRYGSVAELAGDIERYLNERPVSAVPQKPGYVLHKFVRRNRGKVAATAVLLLVVLGAVAFSSAQWARSSALARQLAQREAQEHLTAARMLAYHDGDRALAELDRAMAKDPELLPARIERALLKKRQGDDEGALQEARAVLREYPRTPELHLLLAELEPDPRAKSEHAALGAGVPPHDPFRVLVMGWERSAEALPILDAALQEDPWDFDALWARANFRFRAGDYAQALKDADVLIKVGPGRDNALSWELRGAALVGLGRWSEAVSALEHSLQFDPQNGVVYYNLAMAVYQLGDMEAALRHCERASELRPGMADPQSLLQALEEIAGLDQQLAQDGAAGDLCLARAGYHFHLRNLREAAADFRAAVGANDQLWQAHCGLGLVLLGLESYPEARAAFEKGWQLNQESLEARLGLALASYAAGDEEACTEILEALQHDMPYPAALYLWHVGDRAAGDGVLETAISGNLEGAWETLLFKYLLGRVPIHEVRAAAGGDVLKRCELDYYEGMLALLDGRAEQAEAALGRCAVPQCAVTFEYGLARMHLRRLRDEGSNKSAGVAAHLEDRP